MLLGFLFFISFSSSKLPELLAEISGLTVRIDSPQHQQLLVHYCTFTEFKFENDYGGAIYTYFKTQELTIIDCIFNTVGSRQNGGGIFADIHILTVENSTFETCYAFESNGGGIYCNATTASFSNIYFMNCYTKKDGGAIWVNVTDTITLNNCSFNECYTTDTSGLGAGGGIFVTSASSLIFNSNCSFNKNRAQNGAAIYFQACQNVEINDEIIFSENHAVINGGIMHFENDVESISIVPLFDIIVPDGTTMANLFYFYQTVKKVVIENIKIETEYSKFPTLFYFNGAVEKATIKQLTVSGIVSQTGFIHFNSDVSDVTFENCNFANGSCKNGIVYIQSAENVSFVDCNFEGNTVEVSGGAICIVLCQNFAMESCIFINNTATNGGALYLGCTGSSDVTGINIFQGNRAQIGGAIYIEDTPSVLDFSACYLDASNSALYNAELIFFKKVAHTVILANFDCVISDATQNAVAQFDGPSVDVIEMRNCTCSQSTAGHAAIRFFEGRCYKMLLFDCIFEDNTCSTTGGAIYAENCLHAEFHRCTFNRNVATNGGGVCYLIAIQYLELEDCTFINNSASHGGCFIISNPVTKFHGSNYFSGNIARTTHAGVFWVAGEIDTINIEYPAMILEGDNQATQVGCLFFFEQKINHVNIIGINYTSHTTTNRAAFYFQVSPVTAYIKNVTMSNIDQDSGIRFVNVDDTLTIENCAFINNKATASPTTNGGAIYVQHIYVIESIFINNSCSGSGGALYINSPDCIITGRCVFDGNVAAYDGGCISFASVQTTIDFSDSYVGPNNQASRYSGLFYFSNHVTEAIFKNISWEPLQINPIGAIKFNDGVDKLYLENIAIFNSSKEIVPIYTKGNLIEYVSINTTYEGCHGTEPFINVPDADLVNISSCKFIRNSATSNFLVYAKCQRLLTSGKLVFDSNTVANNAESSVI